MENIRKRVDIRLINKRKKAEKLAAKPNLNHLKIFLYFCNSYEKSYLVFNKPVYCGICILDLSKTLI